MAKLRLDIPSKSVPKSREIIMSKIISVTIDNILFERSTYHTIHKNQGHNKKSRVVQEFYLFIKRNKHKISCICYKDHNLDECVNYLHLKNCEMHNESREAFYRIWNNHSVNFPGLENYYLNGERLEYKDWLIKIRKIKLLQLR